MPTNKNHDENDNDSHDTVDDNSIFIKQESEDYNYSVYSDDERKPPAQLHRMPTTIGIKQEDSELEQLNREIEFVMNCICKQEEDPSDEDMHTARSTSSITNVGQVKEEQYVQNTSTSSIRASPSQPTRMNTTKSKNRRRHVRRCLRMTKSPISIKSIRMIMMIMNHRHPRQEATAYQESLMDQGLGTIIMFELDHFRRGRGVLTTLVVVL